LDGWLFLPGCDGIFAAPLEAKVAHDLHFSERQVGCWLGRLVPMPSGVR